MSLIDPSSHWWNRARWLLPWLCFAVSAIAGFLTPLLLLADDEGAPVWGVIAMTASILVLVAGGFLGSNDGKHRAPGVVAYLLAVAGSLAAMCLGSIIAGGLYGMPDMAALSAVGLVACVLAAAIVLVVARRSRRADQIDARVTRHGIHTTGEVIRTRHWFEGQGGQYPRTRTTVRFTDAQGRNRWASRTLDGRLDVGDTVTVTYLPEGGAKAVVITR